MKIVKGFIIIFVLALFFTACPKRPEPPLRVGTNVWPGYECLYLARSMGYYDGAPIKLVEFSSATEVIRAYRNKTIEVAALTIDEAMILLENDPDIRVVLVTDISNGGDVILSKPDIKSMQDLKGKRVGVESTALGAFVITRAMENAGLSLKDIKIVPLDVSQQERAFNEGLIDAVVTFEPVRIRLLSSGANLLFDSAQIPNEIVDVLIVNKDVLISRSDSMDVLIKGWFRALDYLNKNLQDAARLIAPREGITPEQFIKSLSGIIIPDVKENQRMLGRGEGSLQKGIEHLSQFMLKNNLLKKDIDIGNMLDDRLVKKVRIEQKID